jgi:hypothetical protein
MNKLSMKPKGVRATTKLIEGVVHLSPNRSEGQCLVVGVNMFPKALSSCTIPSEKQIKLRRNGVVIGRFDFALITA